MFQLLNCIAFIRKYTTAENVNTFILGLLHKCDWGVPWLTIFMTAGFPVHNCAGVDMMIFPLS